MSAGSPKTPTEGTMRSSFTGMVSLFSLVLFAACTNDTLGPGSQAAVSARVISASHVKVSGILALRDSSLLIGDTTSLSVTVIDRFGHDITKTLKYKFVSSDTSVASVSGWRGLVTVRGVGRTQILMRASNGFTDSVIVLIAKPTLPGSVTAMPDTMSRPPADAVGSVPPFNAPMLPAASVNVALPAVTGRTIRVPAGDAVALQSALNSAVGGDEIVLPNNAEFTGSFVLPRHSGTAAVTLRSESVPTIGVRVTPSTSASFARLVTTDARPAIQTATGARNWRVIGVSALLKNTTEMNYAIVRIGDGGESAMSDFVSDIVLDRLFVSAGATGNTRRCVGLNGNALAVIDSWLVECHSRGFDSQAVAGWTGIGPFLIANNHMEASSEHIVFGGGDPKVQGVTPSDITIRGNYLYRPMAWANAGWLIKNLFELKHAKRLLFEGNILENNWVDGQVGFAILFQALSQDGNAPWSTIQDITVRNNIIRNSTSGIDVISRVTIAGVTPTEPSRRILFANNLLVNVGHDPVTNANGRLVQLIGDHEDLTMLRNTIVGTGGTDVIMLDASPSPAKRLTIVNNVFPATLYGFMAARLGEGAVALQTYAPNAIVEGNVFTGRASAAYPAGNSFPAAISLSDFVSAASGDYTLRGTLAFAAHSGALVGVDGQALLRMTADVTRQ